MDMQLVVLIALHDRSIRNLYALFGLGMLQRFELGFCRVCVGASGNHDLDIFSTHRSSLDSHAGGVTKMCRGESDKICLFG